MFPIAGACGKISASMGNAVWDGRFLEMAKLVSSWSKDPSTKVGSVIVNESRVVLSVGFNGLPRGLFDSPERLQNRELKYQLIVHAEMNALLFATRDLTGCTIYTYPFLPCSRRAGAIVQAGISRVVSQDYVPDRWRENFKLSQKIFSESGVAIDLLGV